MPAAASGWDLATAGRGQAAPPVGPGQNLPFARDCYASWWQRLGGAVLDGIFVWVTIAALLGGMALVTYLVSPIALEDWFSALDDDAIMTTNQGLWFIPICAIFFLTAPLWDILWIRSSAMGKPGQRIAGFRVTTMQGERLSTGRSIGRWASKLIDVFAGGLVALSAAFTIGLSQKRQAVHEMIASTVSVQKTALDRRAAGDPTTYLQMPQPHVWPSPSPTYVPPPSTAGPAGSAAPPPAPPSGPAYPPPPPPSTPPPHSPPPANTSGPFV